MNDAQEQRVALTKAERKGRAAVQKQTRALSKLVIEYLQPDQIKPNPWNPNRQSQHDFELLLRSMEEDGFTQPVVCVRLTQADFDEVPQIRDAGYLAVGDVMIVDGEHRWRGGAKLAFEKIPATIAPMTARQAMIATLRHNRARGSEDIELSADLLRDLELLGSKDWALDSLGMDEVEWERMIEDLTAPEALAAEDYSQAWEPDSAVDPEGDGLSVQAQTGHAPSGDWTKAATPEAVQRARDHEQKIAEAKTDEQRRMAQADRGKDFHRVSLVFAGEEGKLVKDVLGGAPAETVIELVKAKIGQEYELREKGWVTIDGVIGSRLIPAESAKVIRQAMDKAKAEGEITDKNAWQLLEYLAADYLGAP